MILRDCHRCDDGEALALQAAVFFHRMYMVYYLLACREGKVA